MNAVNYWGTKVSVTRPADFEKCSGKPVLQTENPFETTCRKCKKILQEKGLI